MGTGLNAPPFDKGRIYEEHSHITGGLNSLSVGTKKDTKDPVILKCHANASEVIRARELQKASIPQLFPYIDDFECYKGRVLVLRLHWHAVILSPFQPCQRIYSSVDILRIGHDIHTLLKKLKTVGYCLSHLHADDFVLNAGRAYLINYGNIERLSPHDSLKAEADLVQILIRMALKCPYEKVIDCVTSKDGKYVLTHLPKELHPDLRTLIRAMLPSSEPTRRLYRNSRWLLIVYKVVGVALGVVWSLLGPITAPKLVWIRDYSERSDSIEKRNSGVSREACIAAIQNGQPGHCAGLDLSGIEAPNADLRKINLDNAILKNANLEGANLLGMTLRNVDFEGANLREANLSWVIAKEVVWEEVDLMNASLKGANLKDADFSSAHLDEVDLTRANISHANFSGVNLSNQKLVEVTAVGTRFYGAFLQGITFESGDYTRANFSRAVMNSAVFTGQVLLDESEFRRVMLVSAMFINAEIHSINFHETDMEGVIIDSSEFYGASFSYSDLDDARVTYSNLSDGSFYGSSLRDAHIECSIIQMDFEKAKMRGIDFVSSDLTESINIQSYASGNPRFSMSSCLMSR